jgi:hypothetical protein
MGTRNLVAVILDGEYKVAQYSQWDGYIEGNGYQICDFLDGLDLKRFKKKLRKTSFTNSHEEAEFDRSDGVSILRHIYLGLKLKLMNDIDFAADSLFCEYAYVIDLDNKRLEVYEGFNKDKLSKDERFYGFTTDYRDTGEYQPVRFVCKISFKNLTKKKLLKKFNRYSRCDD